ncbi:MAG TPA: PilZ domain-containing protein, partial [Polyangiaceae bacterium]
MVQERRAYLRKVITATAAIDSAGERIEGFCHNVSRGGCFLATTSVVPIGKELVVEIRLSGGATLPAKGRVVWVRETSAGNAPAGMGVAFLEIGPEALATIGQLAAPPARAARSQTVIGVAPPAAATIAAAIKKRDDALLKEVRAAELSWTEVPLPSSTSEPPPALPPEPAPPPEPIPPPPAEPPPAAPSPKAPTPTPTAPPAVAEPTEPAPPTLSDEIAPLEPPPPPIESLAPPPPPTPEADQTAPTAPIGLVHVIPPPPPPSSPWAERPEPP